MKHFINFVVLCFFSTYLFSQNITLPSDSLGVLDTLDYKGEKIVLFKDNTWTFISDFIKNKEEILFYDTAKFFTKYWDNNELFAYDPALDSNHVDSVQLVLVDSLHKFVLPHFGTIYSGFGWRGRIAHKGLDIGLELGTPVKAAFDGKVRFAQYHRGGYGNLVIIRHRNGLETYYAHLSKIYVKPNQIVKAGQVIGAGGSTGRAWGTHLHFETRWNGRAFDPLKIIDFENQKLKKDTVVLRASDFKIQQSSKAYAQGYINGEKAPIKYGGAEISEPKPFVKNKVKTSSPASAQVNYSKIQPGTYHTIQKGETLYFIAKKYGTTVEKLCKLNKINPNTILQIGQKIRVK